MEDLDQLEFKLYEKNKLIDSIRAKYEQEIDYIERNMSYSRIEEYSRTLTEGYNKHVAPIKKEIDDIRNKIKQIKSNIEIRNNRKKLILCLI